MCVCVFLFFCDEINEQKCNLDDNTRMQGSRAGKKYQSRNAIDEASNELI